MWLSRPGCLYASITYCHSYVNWPPDDGVIRIPGYTRDIWVRKEEMCEDYIWCRRFNWKHREFAFFWVFCCCLFDSALGYDKMPTLLQITDIQNHFFEHKRMSSVCCFIEIYLFASNRWLLHTEGSKPWFRSALTAAHEAICLCFSYLQYLTTTGLTNISIKLYKLLSNKALRW